MTDENTYCSNQKLKEAMTAVLLVLEKYPNASAVASCCVLEDGVADGLVGGSVEGLVAVAQDSLEMMREKLLSEGIGEMEVNETLRGLVEGKTPFVPTGPRVVPFRRRETEDESEEDE